VKKTDMKLTNVGIISLKTSKGDTEFTKNALKTLLCAKYAVNRQKLFIHRTEHIITMNASSMKLSRLLNQAINLHGHNITGYF
jgi:predicted MarR family transcription regulator